jgi:DNA-binding IclR family transcriptional regulator
MRTRKSKSAPVGVIGKVLRVLELLDRSPHGLQLREISTKTGINKSTVHRFLSHLEAEGYLFRDAVGTYMLGPKLARLGSGISFQTTLCRICRPTLESLRAATDETVNLAVLDGFEILYLDVLESQNTFRLVFPVGVRSSVHCTALGKAILANLDDEQRKQEILSSIQFVSYTPRTVVNIARLKRDLVRIREEGYSLDDEEAMNGARCIGAAIFDADGKVVGAISISGPVVRVTKERLRFFSGEVCKAAWEISRRLGYRAAKPERLNSPPRTNGREVSLVRSSKAGQTVDEQVAETLRPGSRSRLAGPS